MYVRLQITKYLWKESWSICVSSLRLSTLQLQESVSSNKRSQMTSCACWLALISCSGYTRRTVARLTSLTFLILSSHFVSPISSRPIISQDRADARHSGSRRWRRTGSRAIASPARKPSPGSTRPTHVARTARTSCHLLTPPRRCVLSVCLSVF